MYLNHTDPHWKWGSCLSVASKNNKSSFKVIKAIINEWCRGVCLVWVGILFWSPPLVYSQRHFGAQFLRLDFYSMSDSNVPLIFANNWGKVGASDVENKGKNWRERSKVRSDVQFDNSDVRWELGANQNLLQILFPLASNLYLCDSLSLFVCLFDLEMMKTLPQNHRVSRNEK